MKKLFISIFAIFALFMVASCSFLDESVESIQFAELPKAAFVKGTEESLVAQIKVIGGGDSAGVYTLTILPSGQYTVAKQNGSVQDPGFAVKGYEGLAANAEPGNYVLEVSLSGITLLHSYRVVSEASEVYFKSGKGTEAEPYLVETAQQLFNIRYFANQGAHFELASDIDLTNFKWNAIGTLAQPFVGHLNGAGHKIIGLSNALTTEYETFNSTTTVNPTSGKIFGLFGYAGPRDGNSGDVLIENLEMVNVSISGSLKGAAALIGVWCDVDSSRGNANLTIKNVSVSGSISGNDKIAGFVGATPHTGTTLAGAALHVVFENCVNNATISASTSGSYVRAGGLLGQMSFDSKYRIDFTFKNCENKGNVTVTNSLETGAGWAGDLAGHYNASTVLPGQIVQKVGSQITVQGGFKNSGAINGKSGAMLASAEYPAA